MSTLPAVVSSLIANLEQASQATPTSAGGDFVYLKMTKQGEWVYGAEETEVDTNSAFAIDPNSYAQGFVAWSEDGDLIEERMAVAGQPPIVLADLPPLAMGKWDAQVAFALKGVEGVEEGLQLMYKVSSRGGKSCIADLLGKIIERGRKGEAAVCPIVFLGHSSYKHKKYGKIYTPVLEVDEWIDIPDTATEPVAVQAEPEPEPEPEPAPKARRSRKKEPEPETVIDDPVVEPEPEPAPKRRRKRNAA